jgi:hypothetical protein
VGACSSADGPLGVNMMAACAELKLTDLVVRVDQDKLVIPDFQRGFNLQSSTREAILPAHHLGGGPTHNHNRFKGSDLFPSGPCGGSNPPAPATKPLDTAAYFRFLWSPE